MERGCVLWQSKHAEEREGSGCGYIGNSVRLITPGLSNGNRKAFTYCSKICCTMASIYKLQVVLVTVHVRNKNYVERKP